MMSNWKIGMKVVCIKSVSNPLGHAVAKGVAYTILGISECRCGTMLDVDLGGTACECPTCKHIILGAVYAYADLFRPIEEASASSTLARDEAQRADRQEQEFKPELA